ncbi:MAG: alpha/beta fold hydrolase [Salaquimonas sp.]|nr:alpha/beta fold hydrolase [Salaquimonas sp.]
MFVIEFLAISVVIYLAIALGLVISQRPHWSPPAQGEGLAFGEMLQGDAGDLKLLTHFTVRDRTALAYRRYESAQPSNRILILVHGSSWHGMQFHEMASRIAGEGAATVILPDMRGHGFDPVRRGDVDHIGQLEEDMADLIDFLRREHADAQIMLGGHSSGGGFAVRFAGGDYGSKADAFALMAPFLKYDAPTTRPHSGGWARPAIRRIIGLSMLNAVGIRLFNGLNEISFAMPRAVMDGPYGKTATVLYSHRLNVSFAPRPDYRKDLKAIRQPLLVLVGEADESFVAEQYESVISACTPTGTYHVLPGVTHLGIVSDKHAIDIVAKWVAHLPAHG